MFNRIIGPIICTFLVGFGSYSFAGSFIKNSTVIVPLLVRHGDSLYFYNLPVLKGLESTLFCLSENSQEAICYSKGNLLEGYSAVWNAKVSEVVLSPGEDT